VFGFEKWSRRCVRDGIDLFLVPSPREEIPFDAMIDRLERAASRESASNHPVCKTLFHRRSGNPYAVDAEVSSMSRVLSGSLTMQKLVLVLSAKQGWPPARIG